MKRSVLKASRSTDKAEFDVNAKINMRIISRIHGTEQF